MLTTLAEESLTVGDTVDGRFVLHGTLGSGAFGRVWRAFDNVTRQDVALKILKPALAEATGVLARFQREVDILCRLEHPGIVRYVAASNRGPHRYLAMEYVAGNTLLAAMNQRARKTPFSKHEVATIISQIAAALAAAHAGGVVHRDLKPANIILGEGPDGPVARVLDFGVAKVALTPHEQTTVGRLVGTLMYMSPEQLTGQEVDHRADVFALATLAFELLTLRRPYARDARGEPYPIAELPVPSSDINSHYAVLRRIAMEARPKASRHRDDLAPAVDAVLLRGLHAIAAERTNGCVEFSNALRDALAIEETGKRARARAETMAPEELAAAEASSDEGPAETTNVAMTSVLPQPLAETSPDTSPLSDLLAEPAQKRSDRSGLWIAATLGAMVAVAVSTYVLAERETVLVEVPVRESVEVLPVARPTASPIPAEPPPAPDVVPAVLDAGVRRTVRRPAVRDAGTVVVPAPPPVVRDRSPEAVRRQAQQLAKDAETLTDPAARTSIKRCASLSAVRADPDDLDACLRRYESYR